MEEEGKWESIKPDPRGRKMVIPTLQAQIAIHSSDPSVRWTSRAVKFNPRFGVMAVGGEELVSPLSVVVELIISLFGYLLRMKRQRSRQDGRRGPLRRI